MRNPAAELRYRRYQRGDFSIAVPGWRSHLRIYSPQREAETVWLMGIPFNRVDVERGVFQKENLEYLRENTKHSCMEVWRALFCR